MRSIRDIGNLDGKKVLLRASLNVPLDGDIITDTTRLDEALATIQFLRGAGAKTLLISHHSRGPDATLYPVFGYLKKRIPLSFVDDIFSSEAKEAIEAMSDGDIILFENIRRY